MVLHAGITHFPNNLGFLFNKHDGMTACEATMAKYGKDNALACIRNCIPSGTGYPILHSVVKHAPHLENDFMLYYLDDLEVRDRRGRSLSHTKIAMGTKFLSDALFISKILSKTELKEKDPVTGLYPFMLAAVESNCDLSGIYTLLRRKARLCCPNNLDGDVSSSIGSSNNSGTTNRKRKRGNDGDSVSEVTTSK